MSHFCEEGHSPIIDHSTATVVCQGCAKVLEEGLAYNEVMSKHQFSSQRSIQCETEKEELINGENAYELLVKIGEKLHLNQSSIDNSYKNYKKSLKKLKRISDLKQNSKKKRLLMSYENILAYAIYVTLKEASIPRSIKEICFFSGGLKCRNVLQIGKFIEANRDKDTPSKRLKPLTAKDVILTHYPYIEGLSFDDVKQIFHKLNCIGPISFTPTTTAAGIIYLYVNFVQHSKQTLHQISSLFQVTPTSIQRFTKEYKKWF